MSDNNNDDNNNMNQSPLTLTDRFERLSKLFATTTSLTSTIIDNKSYNYEFLIDLLIAVYTDIQRNVKSTRDKNSSAQKFSNLVKPLVDYINQLQLSVNDFEQIKIIGKGAFGQVSLVKSKHNEKMYAMKVLNKVEMTKRAEKACYKEERDILVNSSNDWFTKLYYAFQDSENLYLIMDYYIGGDFLTLLMKYDDTLPEDMCRFYAAEIILGISTLHDLGYIHRDIKPPNILIDSHGHIRLGDFGSCVRASTVKSDSSAPVGTPDYVSPEILDVIEGKNRNDCPYSYETDWWSLGIVLFELFYGQTPFYAESLVETYFKIMNHKTHFIFPVNAEVTDEAKDLISNLVTDRYSRYKNIQNFKDHPWFTGIEWDEIRYQTPPYHPQFSGPDDTSNFDISDIKPLNSPTAAMKTNKDVYVELSFVGFTSTLPKIIKTESQSNHKIENEIAAIITNNDENLEKGDNDDRLEQLSLENRLKTIQQEYGEMSQLLAEVKKEKNALSNKLRIKEGELDEHIEKNSQLRQQLRNYEKMKRQNLEEISSLQAELETQKILRKQDQIILKNHEEKIESLENQLQRDSESTHSFTNEKQCYLKKITDLEQQILLLEEENVSMKDQNNDLKKSYKELCCDLLNLDNQNLLFEHELKELVESVTERQRCSDSLDKMIEMLDFNIRKYKFLQEKNNRIGDNNTQIVTGNKSIHNTNTSWQERRSARVDKQELLTLQLELKSEILEKQKIHSELIKLQQDFDNVNMQLIDSKNEILRLKKQAKSMNQYGENNRNHLGFKNNHLMMGNDNVEDVSSRSFLKDFVIDMKAISSPISSNVGRKQTSVMSPDSSNENYDYHNKFGHSFIIRTFITPIKCYVCTSLMIGLVRQGYVCEVCGYACHVDCVDSGSSCPFDETKQRPVGIDPQKGIGTAYEGFVKIPKPRGGVRKGWIRMFVVVCDFKLFLYDIINTSDSSNLSLAYANMSNDSNYNTLINTPSISASTIIDMRDEYFSVSDVNESDVIHASAKDVPCIFRITTSMIGDNRDGLQKFTQLMLVDKESEKNKWIEALTELHRIIRRNKISHRNMLRCYHLLNTLQINSLRHIHNIHCCTMLDETRLLIGCEDCLLCCDLDIHSYHRLNQSKKFSQISYVHSEQLIVTLSGKQKQIKLIPIRALDNDGIDWIKISETKNASAFTVAFDNSVAYVCVAVRKTLSIFEITHKKSRYIFHHEIQMPVNIQTLNTCKDNLVAIGTSSNFVVYHVNRSEQPLYLVNQDSPDLIYLIQNSIDPFLCQPIGENEWLLVFAHYGVYVDDHGKRTRCLELQYPSQPIAASILRSESKQTSYLLIFALTHIDVFDINEIRWVQTINIKATRPLQTFADNILFCKTNALDLPNLIQITMKDDNLIRVSGDNIKAFTLTNLNQKNIQSQSQDYKKNMKIKISAPTDFSHISHLGPGSGPFSANLIDLNDMKEKKFDHSSKDSLSKSHTSLQYK
ncbi:Acyl-coenzyme A thioesterase 13 [Dermatophagoides farinae]|uniref:non-specific serine/threonine protein kinase n=1 Tax=Dermatophagoides farinae TaxID=6954 RepID=A0A922L4L9_DERFA|nr:Acyl-coenzyme A thioesterase 13 [Dermatophagoides farinae]